MMDEREHAALIEGYVAAGEKNGENDIRYLLVSDIDMSGYGIPGSYAHKLCGIYCHRLEWYLGATLGFNDYSESVRHHFSGLNHRIEMIDLHTVLSKRGKNLVKAKHWLTSRNVYRKNAIFANALDGITPLWSVLYDQVEKNRMKLLDLKKSLMEYQSPSSSLKELLCVLFATEWILRRSEVPPMDFRELLEFCVQEPTYQKKILDFVMDEVVQVNHKFLWEDDVFGEYMNAKSEEVHLFNPRFSVPTRNENDYSPFFMKIIEDAWKN